MQQKARFLIAAEEPEMVERSVAERLRARIAIDECYGRLSVAY
jgi:hypothetical protein